MMVHITVDIYDKYIYIHAVYVCTLYCLLVEPMSSGVLKFPSFQQVRCKDEVYVIVFFCSYHAILIKKNNTMQLPFMQHRTKQEDQKENVDHR